MLARRAASNLAAVKMDLAGAILEGDADRVTVAADADRQRRRRSFSTGPSSSTTRCSSATSRRREHVAVFVPGVGDGTNLCDDWIPEARNLFEAATLDRRRPVEGLRQPGRHPRRGGGLHRMQRGPVDGRGRPDRVRRMARARPGAVPHRGRAQLRVDRDGRGAGRLRPARHRRRRGWEPGHDGRGARASSTSIESHFFSEQAPGDVVGELGVFGSPPARRPSAAPG